MLYNLNIPNNNLKRITYSNDSIIRILSYNIFLRPPFISHNHSDYKDDRCKIFSKILVNYDIIALQEVHTCFNFRCNNIIENACKHGLRYHYITYASSMFSKHLANNALLILSRFPIISNDYISFSKYGGYDGIIEKGCNYCKIQVGINTNIHLFNTHLQSSFCKNDTESTSIRQLQLKQLKQFISKKESEDEKSPVVCCGDFNINYFNTLEKDYLYEIMTPLKDIYDKSTESSIDILYDKNGMENDNICNVCKLCKEDIKSNYIIEKQRLDYIFFNKKNTKFKLKEKKILPFNINTKKFNFEKLSDHSAMYAEFLLS
jgi:endonuclease/exonuclease/phosphatase family metal-dependent hydrolase